MPIKGRAPGTSVCGCRELFSDSRYSRFRRDCEPAVLAASEDQGVDKVAAGASRGEDGYEHEHEFVSALVREDAGGAVYQEAGAEQVQGQEGGDWSDQYAEDGGGTTGRARGGRRGGDQTAWPS